MLGVVGNVVSLWYSRRGGLRTCQEFESHDSCNHWWRGSSLNWAGMVPLMWICGSIDLHWMLFYTLLVLMVPFLYLYSTPGWRLSHAHEVIWLLWFWLCWQCTTLGVEDLSLLSGEELHSPKTYIVFFNGTILGVHRRPNVLSTWPLLTFLFGTED